MPSVHENPSFTRITPRSAIVGLWSPPSKLVSKWMDGWRRTNPSSEHWRSHRALLARELIGIRILHGRHHAREFRDYLLWLGFYPVNRDRIEKLYRDNIQWRTA